MSRRPPGLWVLALLLAGCAGNSSPAPIFVGHVATSSGPGKDAGKQAAQAIRLAVEEQTREATENNGRPIVVRHTDASGQLNAFEAEAVRLATVSRVLALLGGTTADEVQRLDRAQVPIVTPCGMRTRGLSELVFFTGLSPAFQGQVLARFTAAELAATRVIILVDERREDSLHLAEAFATALPKAGQKGAKAEIPRPATWRYGEDEPIEKWAKRLTKEKPQAVLVAGDARDLAKLTKQLDRKVLILFGGDDGSGKVLVEAADTDGVYLVTAYVRDLDLSRAKEFVADYRKAFSEDPDVHAALAYDGARLLFAAIRQSQLSGARIEKELAQLKDFPGLTGPLAFAADHQLRRPAFVVRVEKGQLKTRKRFGPEQE